MLRAAAVTALIALLAGACGGSGGDKRLAKADWIRQADAICARTDKAIKAIPDPRSLKEFAVYGAKAVAATDKELKDLRTLKPPKADEAAIAKMLASVDRVLAASKQIVAAAQKNDAARIQQLVGDTDKLNTDANRQARAYGLKACGTS